MADYEHSTYGERIAAVYDQFTSHSPVARFTDATVEFLASIAGKRRVLELGIGTGRIALPLGRYTITRFATNGCIGLRLGKSI